MYIETTRAQGKTENKLTLYQGLTYDIDHWC